MTHYFAERRYSGGNADGLNLDIYEAQLICGFWKNGVDDHNLWKVIDLLTNQEVYAACFDFTYTVWLYSDVQEAVEHYKSMEEPLKFGVDNIRLEVELCAEKRKMSAGSKV